MAKKMAEEIAAAEKSASEQIEAAGVQAARIAAQAKEQANFAKEKILSNAKEKAASILQAAQSDVAEDKENAYNQAKETERELAALYEKNKAEAIKKAEEILLA